MDDLEIEIKSWCENFDELIALLEQAKAKKVTTQYEQDVFFNHPARDFAKTDEALRIRRVNNDVILTYKGPRLGTKTKTRVEHETAINNFDQMKKILHDLGFHEVHTLQKERTIYQLHDVEICLDTIDGLGRFVELEKKGTDKEKNEAELFQLAEKLNLKYFENRSYLEMIFQNAQPPFLK